VKKLVEVENGKMVLNKVGIAEGKPFIVVGIPAFNEERTIARVVLEAQKYADKIVVCDDGSNDMTAEIASSLGAVVIRHEKNGGKGEAMKTLFAEIMKLNPDVVVTLDADGQHDPKEIPKLAKPIVYGESDIVIGSRYAKGLNATIPLYRRGGLAVINWLNRIVNKLDVKDTQNGFRAYSKKALNIIATHESKNYGVESEQLILAAKADLRIIEVPVNVKYAGLEKTSKKPPLTHGSEVIGFILRAIVEERPLIFLGLPGIVSLFVGAWFGVWMLQIYAAEHHIITNIALASMAFILIGFFCLSTAITLYAILRLEKKTNNKSKC
jgi:glycosyltransferase involved in cell wall biosynthesis